MKKTLLLSVVASTMIMAGGDIAPIVVEPVVEVSNWDFSGQAVVYYQAWDRGTDVDLFDQAGARANAGIQLRAVNKDVFWGIGAGAEVSGIATLGLENDIVSGVMHDAGNGNGRGGWISQAYLTYGFGNTSIKAGRQELPKSLSPFAFSEGWNVFKNTFDSVLLVNTDISNTTIVGAWVESANKNGVATNMSAFNKTNDQAGIYMLTAQNKSIEGLTLTGSYYYAADFAENKGVAAGTEDAHILWGDATYAFNDFVVAGQAGTVMDDDFDKFNKDSVVAFGLKAGGNFGMFNASIAYSNVDNGGDTADGKLPQGLFNVGGVKTPLYTQMIFNQDAIRFNNSTFVAKAGVKALGGKFGLAYGYSDLGARKGAGLIDGKYKADGYLSGDYSELDLTYKTKVFNDSTTLFAGYIYQDRSYNDTLKSDFSDNTLRLWGRYNF